MSKKKGKSSNNSTNQVAAEEIKATAGEIDENIEKLEDPLSEILNETNGIKSEETNDESSKIEAHNEFIDDMKPKKHLLPESEGLSIVGDKRPGIFDNAQKRVIIIISICAAIIIAALILFMVKWNGAFDRTNQHDKEIYIGMQVDATTNTEQ